MFAGRHVEKYFSCRARARPNKSRRHSACQVASTSRNAYEMFNSYHVSTSDRAYGKSGLR